MNTETQQSTPDQQCVPDDENKIIGHLKFTIAPIFSRPELGFTQAPKELKVGYVREGKDKRGKWWVIIVTAGGNLMITQDNFEYHVPDGKPMPLVKFYEMIKEAGRRSGDALVPARRINQSGIRELARWHVGAHYQGQRESIPLEASVSHVVEINGNTYLPRWVLAKAVKAISNRARHHVVVPDGHWPAKLGLMAAAQWEKELDWEQAEAEAEELRKLYEAWLEAEQAKQIAQDAIDKEQRLLREAKEKAAQAKAEERRKARIPTRVVDPAWVEYFCAPYPCRAEFFGSKREIYEYKNGVLDKRPTIKMKSRHLIIREGSPDGPVIEPQEE
ncbi:hypothetical protein [Acidiphilium acidophilum]|uniref:hypothetical protein n=1 Tax=Acidiphilium acidophilum TaxID=76588 RepID=UPI002E8E7970|nr:hypothetical protein [Acidiphilium acidophilum]